MWLDIVWWQDAGQTIKLREDGAYGPLQLTFDVNGDGNVDVGDTVYSLLDLNDPNTRIYEVHGAITQEWASKLLTYSSAYASVPVAYDRISGAVTYTVGDIAAQAPGTSHETFHFVLNNKVVKDNRIPPYGMAYNAARTRNALPVPETQYGNPGRYIAATWQPCAPIMARMRKGFAPKGTAKAERRSERAFSACTFSNSTIRSSNRLRACSSASPLPKAQK